MAFAVNRNHPGRAFLQIHIVADGAGAEVEGLRAEGKLEGLQLYINPEDCIDCGACVPACPPEAIYDTEDECIDFEGNDESVIKNYEFYGLEWDGDSR